MDIKTSGFWKGFEKRASGAAGAAGGAAAALTGGGLWKLLQKSKATLPGAGGVHGHIGDLLRKAEGAHPALGPGLALGIPAAGAALAGKAVHKLTRHLENKLTSRTSRLKGHLSDIAEKIKKYFGKVKSEQPQQPK